MTNTTRNSHSEEAWLALLIKGCEKRAPGQTISPIAPLSDLASGADKDLKGLRLQLEELAGRKLYIPQATLLGLSLSAVAKRLSWIASFPETPANLASLHVPIRAHVADLPLLFIGEYIDLGRHLPADLPYHAYMIDINFRGANLGVDFPGAASILRNELLRLQPFGPYVICGYCFAQVIAYEAAKQLEALGETIAYFGSFEAATFDKVGLKPISKVSQLTYFAKVLLTPRKGWIKFVSGAVLNRIRWANNLKERGITDDNLYRGLELRELQCDADIVLCKEASPRAHGDADPGLAWKKWFPRANVHIFPGTHESFLQGENAKKMAHFLNARIEQALKRVQASAATRNA